MPTLLLALPLQHTFLFEIILNTDNYLLTNFRLAKYWRPWLWSSQSPVDLPSHKSKLVLCSSEITVRAGTLLLIVTKLNVAIRVVLSLLRFLFNSWRCCRRWLHHCIWITRKTPQNTSMTAVHIVAK